MTEAPHVPADIMKRWQKAIKEGSSSSVDLVIAELMHRSEESDEDIQTEA